MLAAAPRKGFVVADRFVSLFLSLRRLDRRSPEVLLLLIGAAAALSFSTWMALLNNFAVERAAFTGIEIGTLQSLREIPGFLAFTAVFVLLVLREQPFVLLSLALLGVGTALTGFFPTVVGLYLTTVLMSVGFHYCETLQQSLALQWVGKDRAPIVLGRVIAAASLASLGAYALIWVAFEVVELDYMVVYAVGGGCGGSVCLVRLSPFPAEGGAAQDPDPAAALLAVLWADLPVRGPAADLYRLRRLHDGREVRLQRR